MFDRRRRLGPRLREDDDVLGMCPEASGRHRDGENEHGPQAARVHPIDDVAGAQSPSVSSDALPPAAVVLTVTVFSVAKRGR